MDFFWLVIVAGLLTNLAVSGQTLRGVLQWSLQNPFVSIPLAGGVILLTLLERFVNPPLPRHHLQKILKWFMQVLRWGTVAGLLAISLLSYLVPVSLSPLAITIIPLAVIAFFLFAIQTFPGYCFNWCIFCRPKLLDRLNHLCLDANFCTLSFCLLVQSACQHYSSPSFRG